MRTRFGRKLPVPFLWGLPGIPASRQKPPQTLQNHPSNPCREFGQNWSRNPPNFGRPKIALALRFPLFFHFSRTCFGPPFWNLPAPFLDPFLGPPVFRFKCRCVRTKRERKSDNKKKLEASPSTRQQRSALSLAALAPQCARRAVPATTKQKQGKHFFFFLALVPAEQTNTVVYYCVYTW